MRPDAVHRALDAELAAIRERRGAEPRVLDVGGGSGVWAVPLAQAGCRVTVVDPSPNALATLARRTEDAGVGEWVTGVQGDTDALAALVPEGEADLVLGHGVLEVVDDAAVAAAAFARALAPHGAVSVLVANRDAAVLHRALAGRVDEARRLLADPDGRLDEPGEPLLRRFDVDGICRLLGRCELEVELVQGDGVLVDVVPGAALDANPRAAHALAEIESVAANRSPLRDIASRLHLLARHRRETLAEH